RVVVQPSPSRRESDRFVAYGIPALEAGVAGGALVLALQRRAEQGVGEHACGAGAYQGGKPRGHTPGCERDYESGKKRRARPAAERPERCDTPRGAPGDPPPGRHETGREGREGSDLRRPGVGRGGGYGSGGP